MKKIRRLSDIREEKMRLRIRELELEKQIRENWKDWKSQFSKPGFTPQDSTKTESGTEAGTAQGFWSTALDFGVAYLGKQVAATAGHATEARVQEGLDRLTRKLRNYLERKKRH